MHPNPSTCNHPGIMVGLLLLLAIMPFTLAAQDAPHIVTSIRPIHSLMAGLTESVSSPELLIDQLQSPHHYHMKPSDIKKIERADIVIYAGPQIETFMQSLLKRLSGTHIIAWSQVPGMVLHPARALHDQPDPHPGGEHELDGHLWLSSYNAQRLVNHLRDLLLQMDPDNGDLYRRNAKRLLQRLQDLRQSINVRLSDIKDRPFIQFHDAFQYFEQEFDLSRGYFFTTGSEHKVGIRQLRQVRRTIRENHIRCIFYEPPVIPPVIDNLVIHPDTRVLPLEPIGQDMPIGKDLYFQLMDNISRQLEVCLK